VFPRCAVDQRDNEHSFPAVWITAVAVRYERYVIREVCFAASRERRRCARMILGANKSIGVLVADDHCLVAQSIAVLLQREFNVLGIAQDGRAMVTMARQFKPDVIVSDITMPHLNGIDATAVLNRDLPDSKILILTMHEDVSLAEEAFRAGAKGFLLKMSATQELLSAVRTVANGDRYITPALSRILSSGAGTVSSQSSPSDVILTPRQRELLLCIGEGKTMKEVGVVLDISTRTAEGHKYEIMRRLGVTTTADLVRYAVRRGLV